MELAIHRQNSPEDTIAELVGGILAPDPIASECEKNVKGPLGRQLNVHRIDA